MFSFISKTCLKVDNRDTKIFVIVEGLDMRRLAGQGKSSSSLSQVPHPFKFLFPDVVKMIQGVIEMTQYKNKCLKHVFVLRQDLNC